MRRLPMIGMRSGMQIRHGNLNDGAGDATMAEYLAKMPIRRSSPAIVRYGGDATAQDFDRLVRAVQLINTSLPTTWKMRIDSDQPTDDDPETGIYVRFLPASVSTEFVGEADSLVLGDPRYIFHSIIRVSGSYDVLTYRPDNKDDRKAVMTLAHELIHALGIGHVDKDVDSIMANVALAPFTTFPMDGDMPQPLSLLYPADREALRVLYGRLDVGDSPDDLGPWSATSTHIHANGQHVAFGVASRNGYAEPWAHGYMPSGDLIDNPVLVGPVTWNGLLFGFTPQQEPVSGHARLTVYLPDSDGVQMGFSSNEYGYQPGEFVGRVLFSNLETWDVGAEPGPMGAGSVWNDGDLRYSLGVAGKTFRQVGSWGGDDGIVTGAFFGENHEGMGGTLQREDLQAAFGGNQ